MPFQPNYYKTKCDLYLAALSRNFSFSLSSLWVSRSTLCSSFSSHCSSLSLALWLLSALLWWGGIG